MKKIINFFTVTSIYCISCSSHFGDVPGSTPCDNTQQNLTVSLNWNGTSYVCTNGVFGAAVPPFATNYNYLRTASANGTAGSLSNPYSYLCQLVSKNDQPGSAACSNPGMGTFTWAIPGPVQTINAFKNANTDVTVDYFDVCLSCSQNIFEARPYFTGVAQVEAGMASTSILMYTQQPYEGTNCQ